MVSPVIFILQFYIEIAFHAIIRYGLEFESSSKLHFFGLRIFYPESFRCHAFYFLLFKGTVAPIRFTEAILSTVSIPSITFPNAAYSPSR